MPAIAAPDAHQCLPHTIGAQSRPPAYASHTLLAHEAARRCLPHAIGARSRPFAAVGQQSRSESFHRCQPSLTPKRLIPPLRRVAHTSIARDRCARAVRPVVAERYDDTWNATPLVKLTAPVIAPGLLPGAPDATASFTTVSSNPTDWLRTGIVQAAARTCDQRLRKKSLS